MSRGAPDAQLPAPVRVTEAAAGIVQSIKRTSAWQTLELPVVQPARLPDDTVLHGLPQRPSSAPFAWLGSVAGPAAGSARSRAGLDRVPSLLHTVQSLRSLQEPEAETSMPTPAPAMPLSLLPVSPSSAGADSGSDTTGSRRLVSRSRKVRRRLHQPLRSAASRAAVQALLASPALMSTAAATTSPVSQGSLDLSAASPPSSPNGAARSVLGHDDDIHAADDDRDAAQAAAVGSDHAAVMSEPDYGDGISVVSSVSVAQDAATADLVSLVVDQVLEHVKSTATLPNEDGAVAVSPSSVAVDLDEPAETAETTDDLRVVEPAATAAEIGVDAAAVPSTQPTPVQNADAAVETTQALVERSTSPPPSPPPPPRALPPPPELMLVSTRAYNKSVDLDVVKDAAARGKSRRPRTDHPVMAGTLPVLMSARLQSRRTHLHDAGQQGPSAEASASSSRDVRLLLSSRPESTYAQVRRRRRTGGVRVVSVSTRRSPTSGAFASAAWSPARAESAAGMPGTQEAVRGTVLRDGGEQAVSAVKMSATRGRAVSAETPPATPERAVSAVAISATRDRAVSGATPPATRERAVSAATPPPTRERAMSAVPLPDSRERAVSAALPVDVPESESSAEPTATCTQDGVDELTLLRQRVAEQDQAMQVLRAEVASAVHRLNAAPRPASASAVSVAKQPAELPIAAPAAQWTLSSVPLPRDVVTDIQSAMSAAPTGDLARDGVADERVLDVREIYDAEPLLADMKVNLIPDERVVRPASPTRTARAQLREEVKLIGTTRSPGLDSEHGQVALAKARMETINRLLSGVEQAASRIESDFVTSHEALRALEHDVEVREAREARRRQVPWSPDSDKENSVQRPAPVEVSPDKPAPGPPHVLPYSASAASAKSAASTRSTASLSSRGVRRTITVRDGAAGSSHALPRSASAASVTSVATARASASASSRGERRKLSAASPPHALRRSASAASAAMRPPVASPSRQPAHRVHSVTTPVGRRSSALMQQQRQSPQQHQHRQHHSRGIGQPAPARNPRVSDQVLLQRVHDAELLAQPTHPRRLSARDSPAPASSHPVHPVNAVPPQHVLQRVREAESLYQAPVSPVRSPGKLSAQHQQQRDPWSPGVTMSTDERTELEHVLYSPASTTASLSGTFDWDEVQAILDDPTLP